MDPTTESTTTHGHRDEALRQSPGLALVWSAEEPHRVGEVARPETSGELVLGRGVGAGEPRLQWLRQRPGADLPQPPLEARRLSRSQLSVAWSGPDRLSLRRLGRAAVRVDGQVVDEAVVREGQLVEVERRLLLLVVRRPFPLPPLRPGARLPPHPFGRADAYGVVGESQAAWALRERVALVAGQDGHVLVTGPTGAGKELVARAIHALSRRSNRPLVARNAATLPAGLIDAELFGSAAGYPHSAAVARPGLIGAADGTTLFLDELSELPVDRQAHLLRVLDDGEYHRLGEARARRVDLRLIGATNRAPTALKHDLLPRLPFRVDVPPLSARREDIPLIAAHLVREATRDPSSRSALGSLEGPPRLSAELVRALLTRSWPGQVRDLRTVLWDALLEARGSELTLKPESAPSAEPRAEDPTPPGGAPGREEVLAAMVRCGGVQERAWRELGLRNRYELRRLLKRYAIRMLPSVGPS